MSELNPLEMEETDDTASIAPEAPFLVPAPATEEEQRKAAEYISASLQPRHLKMLRDRGLSDLQIYRARLRSASDCSEISTILNWTWSADGLGGGIIIPFEGVSGCSTDQSYARVRPDRPRTQQKTKKKNKYESPIGRPNRIYFPPNTRRILRDAAIPLLITEGEFKSLKSDQEGYPCLGGVGVSSFHKPRPKDSQGRSVGEPELNDDMKAVLWSGRRVYLAFDSDLVDNYQVALAEYKLAKSLQQAGAEVLALRIPMKEDDSDGMVCSTSKLGLDDFMVHEGREGLCQLLANAVPITQPPAPDKVVQYLPDDPADLATILLKSINSNFGKESRLRFWREEFWLWREGAYRRLSNSTSRCQITKWLIGEFQRRYRHALELQAKGEGTRPGPPTKVTRALVTDVSNALASQVFILDHQESPSWLGSRTGDPANEILALKNGLLHLPSGRFQPPTTEFFTTCASPFDYNATAPKPQEWLRFLAQLWPSDTESRDTLQEIFGYLLISDTRQQKLFFLIGPKRAGKGTIARILRALVGEANVAAPALGDLDTEFGLSPLLGRSVAIVADARLSKRADSSRIVERLLSISGEDAQNVNRKHRDIVVGKLPVRFLLISNELPELTDTSGALAGRMILLRLTESFYGAEDHGLEARLLRELPGILLWSIEGWRRLQQRGRFRQPATGAKLIRDLEDLTSPVGAFVRERCVKDDSKDKGFVLKSALFEEWVAFCKLHGYSRTGSRNNFGRDLIAAAPYVESGREPRKSKESNADRSTIYKGIRLRVDGDTPSVPDDEEVGSRRGHDAVTTAVTTETPENPDWSRRSRREPTFCVIPDHGGMGETFESNEEGENTKTDNTGATIEIRRDRRDHRDQTDDDTSAEFIANPESEEHFFASRPLYAPDGDHL